MEGVAEVSGINSDERPLVIGVTVLTSHAKGAESNAEVLRLCDLAHQAGLDGIVCSAWEVQKVKETFGNRLVTVVPGIRLKEDTKDDQARVATPQEAIQAGADYLVIGRSVTASANPRSKLERIMEAIEYGAGD